MSVMSRRELKKAEDTIFKCINTLTNISSKTSAENSMRLELTCEALHNHLEFIKSTSHLPSSLSPSSPSSPHPHPHPPPLSPTTADTQ